MTKSTSVFVNVTGRVIGELLTDLRNLRADGRFDLGYRPTERFGGLWRPPGLWFTHATKPPVARYPFPLLTLFPQPWHPLELIAAVRGYGGMMTETRPQADAVRALDIMNGDRLRDWRAYTAGLGNYLFLTPAQVRALYHILTPLNTYGPGFSHTAADTLNYIRGIIWDKLGFHAHLHEVANQQYRYDPGDPWRDQFWGGDLYGTIEL